MWRNISRGAEKWGSELTTQVKIDIENYWKDYVLGKSLRVNKNNGNKMYVLSMFPYPSGRLHMGHVRVYSISDSVARFHRMNGADVVHPMGWDAFGLPAENAARERDVSPDLWTRENIANMRRQLMTLGCLFDWEREIATCDPDYYRWTQRLFLDLYDKGLLYRKGAHVNWDPVDETVLAEEQVDDNGRSWRSGAVVEKKILKQWFIKTTFFAKQLYNGLADLPPLDWKDIIKLQRHWIGECDGITVDFKLSDNNNQMDGVDVLNLWTDKPESIFYCRYIVVPSHSVFNTKERVIQSDNKHKLLSVTAENPITNVTLPIIVSDDFAYAEGVQGYMACPEISEFDKEFAAKAGITYETIKQKPTDAQLFILRKEICEKAKALGIGGYPVSSKLKDWLVSRQRYWGTPIPIIHCDQCGEQPVPVDQLPVRLPSIETSNYKHLSLKSFDDWIKTECPSCGKPAKRETDTLDTFVDSSWYFLRYLDSKNTSEPCSVKKSFENMPVDIYIGGKEHATLHLYYARFMNHFLHSIGRVPEREPFKSILIQGMVMGKSFRVKKTGKYITADKVNIADEEKGIAFTKEDNLPVEITWEKMSKSKYNGVDPSDMFEEFGCDTTRLLILGNVSPMSHRHWDREIFPGILNWQNKMWSCVNNYIKLRSNMDESSNKYQIMESEEFKNSESKIKDSRNYFCTLIHFHYKYTYQLSVAISRLQAVTTNLQKVSKKFIPLSREYELLLASQIIMLAPMAPHFASELWAGMANAENKIDCTNSVIDWTKNVLEQNWPKVDADYRLNLICAVDGSVSCRIPLLPNELNALTHEEALNLILKDQKTLKRVKSGIANSDFKVYTDCQAYLTLTTEHQLNMIEKEKQKANAAAES